MTTSPAFIAERGYFLAPRSADEWLEDKPAHFAKIWYWMLRKAFFRDGDQIPRGAFLTSICDISRAGGHRSGCAYQPITGNQARAAYRALAGAGLITVRRTTRGLIITICDYNRIQQPITYGAPHEKSLHNPREKAQGKPSDRRRKERASSPEAVRLAELLADLIVERNPRFTALNASKRDNTVAAWAATLHRMMDADGRTLEELEGVIRWSQAHLFWQNNILSAKKLREQFDQLFMKMKAEKSKSAPNASSPDFYKSAL